MGWLISVRQGVKSQLNNYGPLFDVSRSLFLSLSLSPFHSTSETLKGCNKRSWALSVFALCTGASCTVHGMYLLIKCLIQIRLATYCFRLIRCCFFPSLPLFLFLLSFAFFSLPHVHMHKCSFVRNSSEYFASSHFFCHSIILKQLWISL